MNITPTTVLLVEDDPADARLIQDALAGTVSNPFRVEWETRLSGALKRLGSEKFEVILLDLSLPDSKGLEAFDQVFQAAPDSLILVLSGLTDEETARQAMERGAHDYFSKGHATLTGCRVRCATSSSARLPGARCRAARNASAR
ncbi:response regulator [Thiobacillus sp.]